MIPEIQEIIFSYLYHIESFYEVDVEWLPFFIRFLKPSEEHIEECFTQHFYHDKPLPQLKYLYNRYPVLLHNLSSSNKVALFEDALFDNRLEICKWWYDKEVSLCCARSWHATLFNRLLYDTESQMMVRWYRDTCHFSKEDIVYNDSLTHLNPEPLNWVFETFNVCKKEDIPINQMLHSLSRHSHHQSKCETMVYLCNKFDVKIEDLTQETIQAVLDHLHTSRNTFILTWFKNYFDIDIHDFQPLHQRYYGDLHWEQSFN